MKLVILDRDGVINEDSDDYIRSAEEFNPIPGSLEAIARLNQAGYRVAVVTNQSGVGRGYFKMSELNRMHAKLQRELAALGGHVDVILFCPHTPDDQCGCRKPKPGMLLDLARRLGTTLEGVPVIGDSQRDMEAARAVGARPILVRTGKGERYLAKGKGLENIPVYRDLAEAATTIIEESEGVQKT